MSSFSPNMEFIFSSEQQRNVEAMREIQVELLQKSKTTRAVRLVASMIRAAVQRSAMDGSMPRSSGLDTTRTILREFPQCSKPQTSRLRVRTVPAFFAPRIGRSRYAYL